MSTNTIDQEKQTIQPVQSENGMTPPPLSPQNLNFNNLTNPRTIYLLLWGAGTITAIGLLITMLDMLSVYLTAKSLSSSSGSFNGFSQMMASMFSFIQVAQVAITFAIVMIVLSAVLLAYLLYRFADCRRNHLTYKIEGLIVVQAVYVISQFPQINGLATIANDIRQGSIGGVLGQALTGGFNSISYISTANIVLNIVCLGVLIVLSVIVARNLFTASILHAPQNGQGKNNASLIYPTSIAPKPIKLSRTAKKVIISVICAACVIGIIVTGYFVYSNFIYKNTVNVMDGVSITYDSEKLSGESTADLSYNWPAAYKNNVEIQNFLNSIQFTLNKKENIANGDKLEVQAKISQADENKYRVRLTGNLFKNVTVSGLASAVTSMDQITQDDLKKFEADGLDAVNNQSKDNLDSNTTVTVSFVGWYYDFNTDTSSSSNIYSYLDMPPLVGVYQVHKAYNSQYFQDTTDSYTSYALSNLIVDKDKKLQTDKIKKSLDSVYVSQPDDLIMKGYTKVKS